MGDLPEAIAAGKPKLHPLPASGVRHGVLTITVLMAVLLYLDRICIAVAAPAISKDFDLSRVQMGWVFSAFFLAYALGQVPAGWLGDRLGARLMLAGSVLAWSLFTGLTGLVTGLGMLLAVRLLFGFGQAGAYPIAARIYSLWIPFQRRALANSAITLGGRAGGALAPAVTAQLIFLCGDWRPVFWVYAFLGVGWTVFFASWFRNLPRQHSRCNPAEVHLIEHSRPPEATNPQDAIQGIPWRTMLESPSLWLQCLTQFVSNVAWVFLITWLPTYLMEVYNLDLATSGWLSSLPLVAGMVGCLLGGLATDALTRRVGLRWGRSLLGIASKLLAAVGLLGSVAMNDPIGAILALAFAAFATDTGLGATWAYFQDTGGPYVGTLLGWANMFGNLGASLGPLFWAYLAEKLGWTMALGVSAGLYVVSAVCWLGIDARVSLVPQVVEYRR
jgi:sugar phosphate permease